jgi:hypothetical protein
VTRVSHEDYDKLVGALLPFAVQMIRKRGEFFPFGATITSAGELVLAAGGDGSERPASSVVIDTLVAGMCRAAGRGEIRAAAVCANVTLRQPGGSGKADAIHIALESSDSDASDMFVVYEKKLFRGWDFFEPESRPGTPRVFNAPRSPG